MGVIIIITIVIIISCNNLFIININVINSNSFPPGEQKWILFFISWNCVLRKIFVADLSPRAFVVLLFSEFPSWRISRSTMLVLLLFDFRSASSSFLLLHLVAGADPLNRYAGFL